MRVGFAWAAIGLGVGLCACSAEGTGGDGDTNNVAPPIGSSGTGGTGAVVPVPSAGTGAAGTGGMAGAAGTAAIAGTGGMAGGAGMAGAAGMAGMAGMGGDASMEGVEPSAITLTALAANGTIGLEWPRVLGATGYRVYWSTTPGVTPQSGQAIDVSVADATYVHRGLTNGTAYHYVVTSVLASGEGPAAPEASATPAGEWVLEALGSGDFDGVTSAARVPRVPIAERVHVLLLADGYLQSELSIFHDHAQHDLEDPTSDVDRWVAEIFSLDPYVHFREAFVVWFLPRASSTHLADGNAAFGGDASTAAGPLWEALDDQGPDAFAFPPPAATTLNYVASFLLFDPARMRAGVSGHAGSCPHPTVAQRRLSCAFGVGHAHEFTHAFAGVRDEYMENDNGPGRISETSNVVPTNRCEELPWAHLLEGRGINETPGLVGAFGTPERGFHSEFGCHMNGTHDNGQYWCESGDERYTSLTLRPDHLCNFCRELTAYSVFRRTGVLPDDAPFDMWKSDYRMAFFDTYGFHVPEGPVPQLVECNRGEPGTPVYEACVP